jgi:hypothetical protein
MVMFRVGTMTAVGFMAQNPQRRLSAGNDETLSRGGFDVTAVRAWCINQSRSSAEQRRARNAPPGVLEADRGQHP